MLELTGSLCCQVPVGNHLPQQFDYLFLSKDAVMVLVLTQASSASVSVCCLRVTIEALYLKLMRRDEEV